MKKTPLLRTLAAIACLGVPLAEAQYSITLLHNNDGESRLLGYSDSITNYGGVARFASLLDETRSYYQSQGHGVVSIFAGDSFLAGKQFQASLNSGSPGSRTFYDALAISRMGYDVSVIGNHEFDFGPSVLAEFISDAQTTNPTTYLSANLDFTAESALKSHYDAGRIAPTKTISVATSAGTKRIGVIGATTETLPFVSSPGGVLVNPVATAVNAQIAALKTAGVDHIVLAGHLQGLSTDNDLVASLDPGVDLIIAGGGDEILQNTAALDPAAVYNASAPANTKVTGLIPGDSSVALSGSLVSATNTYPISSTGVDKGGNTIPIVTTGGNYGYLGRVTFQVDSNGNLSIDASSGPQRVADISADATHGVTANAAIQAESVDPVANFVATLSATKLAETSVKLNQGGSSIIRSRETNLGNLVADSLLYNARTLSGNFGVDQPTIALVNGGGIRANIAAGNVTLSSTFDVSPFGNFVSVVEDVKLSDLRLLLENAYSKTSDDPNTAGITPTGSNGRFAQIAGMEVVYDITATGLTLGNNTVTQQGSRLLDLTIGETLYLQGGQWLVDADSTTVDVATMDFLAKGGDQYFRYASNGTDTYLSQLYSFTTLGLTDQNALQNYILHLSGGDTAFDLAGASPDYASEQFLSGGRITAVPEPSTWALLGLAAAAVALRLRRRIA